MKQAIFLITLNQDIAVSRPVARFFRRDARLEIVFLVADAFRKRDVTGVWIRELMELARELCAQVISIEEPADAVRRLIGREGLLLSASESVLPAHELAHAVFLGAPPSLTRISLQHGLECIGFHHNEAHNQTWRHIIGMTGDVAVSWFEIDALRSVQPDQRAKIMAVGPPIGLEAPHATAQHRRGRRYSDAIHGLVCENLHSVRFKDRDRDVFVSQLLSFARKLEDLNGALDLRPHPGGRYLQKNQAPLPANVTMNSAPLYKQSLDKFAFCISGPSSVIFDMVWAGVPVAVWAPDEPGRDIGVYSSLHLVSDEREWLDFALAAARDPQPFLARQADFLAKLRIPADIPARYRELAALAHGP
ncbi:MAG: hypothetical protein ACR652_08800 [Methylocystis sp.]|uniref:hypothetical protein n=1 Tax=Methylocystis sp. TaxID=1911079 RepID=UPI003DA305EB